MARLKYVSLDTARRMGAVCDCALEESWRLCNADGVVVVPYGVKTIKFASLLDVRVLFLPDTVTTFISAPVRGLEAVATYLGGENVYMESTDFSVMDFSSVQRFKEFPPVVREEAYADLRRSRKLKYRKIRVRPDFAYAKIWGGDAPVELAGPSQLYMVAKGALLDKSGETLLYHPAVSGKSRRLTLPASVRVVGSGSLHRVASDELVLRPTVRRIMPGAFFGSEIRRVVVPSGTELAFRKGRPSRQKNAGRELSYCGAFSVFGGKEVVLPEDMDEIPPATFADSASLKSLRIPDSVREIGDEAFCGCKSLSLVVPDTVRKIGVDAFRNAHAVSLPPWCIRRWRKCAKEAAGAVVAIRDQGAGFAFAYYQPRACRFLSSALDATLDSRFAAGDIKSFGDKVRVALTRLCVRGNVGCAPSDDMVERYEDFVRSNLARADRYLAGKRDTVCQALLNFVGPTVDPCFFRKLDQARLIASALLAVDRGNLKGLFGICSYLKLGELSGESAERLLRGLARGGHVGAIEKLRREGLAVSHDVLVEEAVSALDGSDAERCAKICFCLKLGELSEEITERLLRDLARDGRAEPIEGLRQRGLLVVSDEVLAEEAVLASENGFPEVAAILISMQTKIAVSSRLSLML